MYCSIVHIFTFRKLLLTSACGEMASGGLILLENAMLTFIHTLFRTLLR